MARNCFTRADNTCRHRRRVRRPGFWWSSRAKGVCRYDKRKQGTGSSGSGLPEPFGRSRFGQSQTPACRSHAGPVAPSRSINLPDPVRHSPRGPWNGSSPRATIRQLDHRESMGARGGEGRAQSECMSVNTSQIQVAASPEAEDHNEWLIDESLEETFPASDPTLPVRPGSTVAERYAKAAAEGAVNAVEPHHGS